MDTTVAPREAMTDPAIALDGVVKDYDGNRAVGEIDFAIRRGSVTGLLGGNGAGKTTTIAMIMGLVLPTAGSIRVLGHDMLRERHKVLHRVNFESPYVEMPMRLTVRQNLTVFANLYGVSRVRARVVELAEALELTEVLDRPSGRLSAGQKTRVSLAKALINTPELLLLDEPTASLDPDTADWIRSRLEDYRRERGATILLASHNMAEVERMCDDVIMMRKGEVVDRGAPQELIGRYGRTTMEDVFLDVARGRSSAEVPDADRPAS
ncbi:ABC transporter ATP-binding protein [Amorphus orientalis]|uniref:ABC-2 type transport system ATP-binding protein n=1 Tax=Amorphus orientalis TaxID=649198 RepID=A0AAE3VL51_9HYPH|nr:ABC transporter ATP-binding protein [Amorphus orientalis]MDQ0314002.1 ABC-2 type transport system ATP-binding protein [Amorphus orientalis]